MSSNWVQALPCSKEWNWVGITPLAVSGITYYTKDNKKLFLVGQRSQNVTSYPGFYEFVPSGSIDVDKTSHSHLIDYYKQLIVELYEEVGIESSRINHMKTFALVYDAKDKVFDIGIAIELDSNFSNINKPEYKEVSLVSEDDILNIITNNTVETSRKLLKAWQALH